ncbi:hypothetical protein ACIQPQ_31185 [Streptomyces sp. NPDC091281]|uniref:hypothetical protein n=1 Tax=Streptomyces sp. NPDC091281 TaxID=3365985 RepID=UPI0038131131
MAAREYIGAGGMRLHLDEPLSPEMAAQFDKGELRLADDGEPLFDPDRSMQPQVIQHGTDAPAATRVGRNTPGVPELPDRDAHAGAWATYAVRLGLLATKASTMSRQQLIEWVQAVDAVGTGTVGDAGEGVEGPEHASVEGRPNNARGDEKPLAADDAVTEPEVLLEKPAKTARVDEWRTYAVSLGMPSDEAADSTKGDLQDWVETHEGAHSGDGPGD